MARQFIIDIQQNVLISDGFISSSALTSSAVTPTQISGKFDAVSYSKGKFKFSWLYMITEKYKFRMNVLESDHVVLRNLKEGNRRSVLS